MDIDKKLHRPAPSPVTARRMVIPLLPRRRFPVGEDGFLVLCTESASTKNGIGSKCDYNFIALDIDIRNKATIIIRPDHENDSERIHDIYGEKHGYGSHEPYYVLQTDSVNTM